MPFARTMSPPTCPGAQGPVQVAVMSMVWVPFMAASGLPDVLDDMVEV